jgi:hypothetical protein
MTISCVLIEVPPQSPCVVEKMSFVTMDAMICGELIIDLFGNSPFIKEKEKITPSVLLFHRFYSSFAFLPHSYRVVAAILQYGFAFQVHL